MMDQKNQSERKRPLVIGLVGGIAAGKSTIAGLLEELGLTRIDADIEARAVVAEPTVLDRIVLRFGPQILDPEGRLDRKKLAALVFSDKTQLKDLEAITHPLIRARILARLEQALAEGTSVVLDIPLLIEGGWAKSCDHILYVEAEPALRRARALERGWTAEEFAQREARQVALEVKKRHATSTVRSDRPLPDIRKDLEAALALRQQGTEHRHPWIPPPAR